MSKPSGCWREHDSRLAPVTFKASGPADAPILIRETQCTLRASTYLGLACLASSLDVRECESLACVHAVVCMKQTDISLF